MNFKIVLILILVLFILGGAFSINPVPQLFTELGPYELAQTFIMIASSLIWGRLAIRKKQQTLQGDSVHYTIAAFFAVLSIIVVGRETSFLKVYGAVERLQYGLMLLTTALVVPVLSLLCVSWLGNLGSTWQKIRSFMSTPNFLLAVLSFMFILLGDLFEKEFLPIQSNLVWEETFELMGYIVFLGAALVSESSTVFPKVLEKEVVIP